MKSSEIYRKAISLMDTGDYCAPDCGLSCCAISAAIGGGYETDAIYHKVRKPFIEKYLNSPWWNRAKTPGNQAARKAALLDMAEMFEREGD